MDEVVVDLRFKPKGCTDHPIIRLRRILNQFRTSENARLVIQAYLDDLPPKVIELITAKYGLRVDSIERKGNEVKAVISRK